MKFFLSAALLLLTPSLSLHLAAQEKETPDAQPDSVAKADTAKPDTTRRYSVPEITVTATRAKDRETPAAFETITNETLKRTYYGQDAPQTLSELPSTIFYSDNGNAFGYSYLKLRGFGQDRVAVTLNAMPLNDAESHSVFWINQPDLLSSIEDIQVQRGTAQNAYGAAAIGGVINLQTLAPADRASVSGTFGGGSFDTRRLNVSLTSGLLAKQYSVAARFSRIRSDGYRRNAFTDMDSYFLTATRFDENLTTKLVVFGGRQRNGLAYLGIPRENLDGDRTQNDLSPFDTDNFSQPVYQLINEWRLSPNLALTNTLYHIKGDGFYEQSYPDALANYRLPQIAVSDSALYDRSFYAQDLTGNLVRDAQGRFALASANLFIKRSLDLSDWGWIPQLQVRHAVAGRKGNLLLGGEARFHTGRHFGEVVSANPAPPSLTANQLYYDYDTRKTSLVFYANENFQLARDVNLNGEVRLQNVNYGTTADRFDGIRYDVNYFFLNPKLGANWNATERISFFTSLAYVQREPTLASFQPEGFLPLFKRIDVAQGIYEEPLLKPEKMLDAELGASWSQDDLSVKLNFYWMDFRDELIFGGQLSDIGLPIYGNADRTRHIGGELSVKFRTAFGIETSGNLNLSRNTFEQFTEYELVGGDAIATLSRNGKTIPLTPPVIGNLRVSYSREKFYSSLWLQHVGSQFIATDNRSDKVVSAYTVFNFSAAYRIADVFFKEAELSLTLNNLFDTRYETSGGFDFVGNPRWYVGAPRNVMVSLRLAL